MPLNLYSKESTDTLLAAKLDLAGGTMTGGLTLSASGIIFSDATYLTTAPAGSTLAADQLTAGVVAANPISGPTTAGDVLQYNGTDLVWAAGGGGGGVAWGAITGTVTDQTDLVTYVTGLGYQTASDVSTYVGANAYPLSSNPAGYLTSVPGKSVYTLSGSYTLSSTDANNIVYCPTGAGGGFTLTITIPDDATYSFPVGTIITLCVDNSSSGTDIAFAPGNPGGPAPALVGPIVSSGIGSSTSGHFYITKIASDRWLLS